MSYPSFSRLKCEEGGYFLTPLERLVQNNLSALRRRKGRERLFQKDPSLYSTKRLPELENRLGWIDLPQTMQKTARQHRALAEKMKGEFQKVFLLGMGGSSLAPEVFAKVLGQKKGYPKLEIIDTTHPDFLAPLRKKTGLSKTLFLVSSKSGTTLETLSLFSFFFAECEKNSSRPGRQFMAITDPGTPLQKLARSCSFRHIILAPPDVGGRFSALSPFGLLPLSLSGQDPHSLLRSAQNMRALCAELPEPENPGFLLGALLAAAVESGRDKVTFVSSRKLAAFQGWLEQLLAESLGKDGKGVIPITREIPLAAQAYGSDRLFLFFWQREEREAELLKKRAEALAAKGHPVAIFPWKGTEDLGAEMFRFEIATAVCGALLSIHPFNQPDVQRSKDRTKEILQKREPRKKEAPLLPAHCVPAAAGAQALSKALALFWKKRKKKSYLAIQAFLPPTPLWRRRLQKLRSLLSEKTGLPTTLGFGPRFLHSTGQLHKGGPNTGLFLQLVKVPRHKLPLSGKPGTFAELIQAQAVGDFLALEEKHRAVLSIELSGNRNGNFFILLKAVSEIVKQ